MITAEAEEEVMEAVAQYSERNAGIGRRSFLHLKAALGAIAEHPAAAPEVSETVRRKLIAGFPYSILYRVLPDRVRVLAVRHQDRLPGHRRAQ